MSVQFFDKQDEINPMNGAIIDDEAELSGLLDSLRNREPFFCELKGREFELLVGIGGAKACVQHSRSNQDPPYLVAVSDDTEPGPRHMEFLVDGEPTEVPIRECLSFDIVREIAIYFLRTEGRSPTVSWEELGRPPQ